MLQEYVWASHLTGYGHSDLTLHASQVRDWYGSEDGIDLQALDADCEALRAAAAAAEGALAKQDAQLASLAVAWGGPGAQASRDFLRRHGEASAVVVATVRAAADSLSSLRDELWRSVEGKVAATMAVSNRGARPDWRAAAQTVTTGAGDRATASELVDQQVKPFADNDIRSDWLAAMRSALAAVTAAYDAAAAEIGSAMVAVFDVPGELGPSWSAPLAAPVATAPAGAFGGQAGPGTGAGSGSGPAVSTPIGASGPFSSAWPAPPAAAPAPLPASPQVEPAAMAAPVEPAAMVPPSLPGSGGMPDIGSGLSGFGGQLGDLLGGLLGTSQDALSDLPEPDELDEPDDLDDPLDEEESDGEESGDEEESSGEEESSIDGAVGPAKEALPESLSAHVEPDPPPTPPPPPIEPLAAPPLDPGGTPCEIAAGELPQVGE